MIVAGDVDVFEAALRRSRFYLSLSRAITVLLIVGMIRYKTGSTVGTVLISLGLLVGLAGRLLIAKHQSKSSPISYMQS